MSPRHLPVVPSGRPHTLRSDRYRKSDLRRALDEYPTTEHPRAGFGKPSTWGECLELGVGTVTPCPYVSCEAHLAIEVNERNGSMRERFPGLEVWQLPATCVFAVAAQGEHTMEDVGRLLNLTRQRVDGLARELLAELRGNATMAECDR